MDDLLPLFIKVAINIVPFASYCVRPIERYSVTVHYKENEEIEFQYQQSSKSEKMKSPHS